jgi:hypothetical protein
MLFVFLAPAAPHHLVRPPGGFNAKQSLQRSFWFLAKRHREALLLRFTQVTALFKRSMKASLASMPSGSVVCNLSLISFQAFSIALKSCEHLGYPSTN